MHRNLTLDTGSDDSIPLRCHEGRKVDAHQLRAALLCSRNRRLGTSSARRTKVGVLVPFTNTNLEPDMAMLCPSGCTFHFHRLGGYDLEEIPGSDQMSGLGASDIAEELRLLSGVRPAAILYGCTSATLTHGVAFDAELAEKIRALSPSSPYAAQGTRSLTAAGCVVRSLRALGAERVALASPYVSEINDQAVAFLRESGVSTVRVAGVDGALSNYGQGELTPGDVLELAMRADHEEADALVLSCTDMRSVEAIEAVEAATGKPVVTSNQAMVFALMEDLGLKR